MENNLKKYFPMIRTKEEILSEIHTNAQLNKQYSAWTSDEQDDFLSFCSGARGVKLLYDSFFKEIMNPEIVPSRLEELLSLILQHKVKFLSVLPVDSTRLADETSLLIMDIVVELDDGSIVDVEVQKLGYAFPGQRSACYSADLLLRQYKRIRDHKKKTFSYRDIRRVYTVILFEKSLQEFHKYPNHYIHHMKQQSDTGLKLEMLQEFIFIPLDIFRNIQHNKSITNKLEAWLALLSMDEPETIIQLITDYPEFKDIYEEVYTMCLNVEKVMGMYSKELRELDRNTVKYMIDEMQATIDQQLGTIGQQQSTIDQQLGTIDQQKQKISLLEKETSSKDRQILVMKYKLQGKSDAEIAQLTHLPVQRVSEILKRL